MRLKGRIVNVRCEAEVPINKQPLHRKFFADFNQEFSIVTRCSYSELSDSGLNSTQWTLHSSLKIEIIHVRSQVLHSLH